MGLGWRIWWLGSRTWWLGPLNTKTWRDCFVYHFFSPVRDSHCLPGRFRPHIVQRKWPRSQDIPGPLVTSVLRLWTLLVVEEMGTGANCLWSQLGPLIACAFCPSFHVTSYISYFISPYALNYLFTANAQARNNNNNNTRVVLDLLFIFSLKHTQVEMLFMPHELFPFPLQME